MTEYNVYIIDLDTGKEIYLYTTLASDLMTAAEEVDADFYREATGINVSAFQVIPTEDDDMRRDELILDYIIKEDDSTGTISS